LLENGDCRVDRSVNFWEKNKEFGGSFETGNIRNVLTQFLAHDGFSV